MISLLFILSFNPFYFIHYSDPQIGRNVAAQPNLDTAVNQINDMQPPPQFIIVAGDMGNNPGNQSLVMQQWEICDSLLDLLTVPKYYIPGNNDVGYEDEGCWTPGMLQFYRNFWGADYYTFDADSCHFIALNSTLLDTYSSHACFPYSLEQDSFMRWDLQNIQGQEYKHLFFFFHFPLYLLSPYEPNGHIGVDRPRRDTILQYLLDHNFTAVFTGHWHLDYTNFYWPSLLQTGIAACETDPPVGYRVVKVLDDGIETFTIYLSDPIDSLPLVNIVTAAIDHDTVEVNVPVSFTCGVDSMNFPDWNDLSFKWKFGDGDSSMSANTVHVYSDTGHYQIIFAAYELHDKCALYRFNIVVEEATFVQENITENIPDRRLCISTWQNFVELEIAEPGYVILDLYQSDGRLMKRLMDRYFGKGRHRVELDMSVPSGVYFVRLSTTTTCLTHKFVYMR
jgi:hypothetical protein